MELVAEACEVLTDLGKKGVRGVLKSVASRQAFLSELSHRIRFVYLPKPARGWTRSRWCRRDLGRPSDAARFLGG